MLSVNFTFFSVVSFGPMLLPNLFCLQRKARAGPRRVWTNFSPSSNSPMCWFCHICYCFNLSALRRPNPAGFAQSTFPDSTGTPSKSQRWRAPCVYLQEQDLCSQPHTGRLASSQSTGEERLRRVCLQTPQLMGGKGAGRNGGGKDGVHILNYHFQSSWISAGWMAVYCWHRPAVNHYLSGATRNLQGWLSHPPSWRHSRSEATYVPWLWAVPVAQK